MGYGATTHATATLTLPAQVRIGAVSLDHGPGCTVTGQQIDCDLDWLNPGQDVYAVVGGTVTAAGTLTATATAWATGEENRSDNQATLTQQVGSADTPVTKTPSAEPAPAPAPTVTPPAPLTVRLQLSGRTVRAVSKRAATTYRWQLCRGTRCATIAGAKRATLALPKAWAGRKVTVTATTKTRAGVLTARASMTVPA